jgi:hypothetical protein
MLLGVALVHLQRIEHSRNRSCAEVHNLALSHS